jgi:phage protein U
MASKITTNVPREDRGGALGRPRPTPAGFLEVDCYTARVGVYQYTEPDGTVVGELLPPEEVFRADSMAGYLSAPVTREHPAGLVTPENARQHTRGVVMKPAWQDGDKTAVTLVIHDAELAGEIQSGQRDEVSPGYLVDVEESPGTWVGKDGRAVPYQRIQRNRRINHVAVVKYARGGPEIRVRIDGLPTLAQDGAATPPHTGGTPPPGDSSTMTVTNTAAAGAELKSFRLDSGLEIQVPPGQIQILEDLQRKVRADGEKAKAEITQLNKDAAELRAESDKLKAELKTAKERADGAEKKLAEASSPAAISKLAAARAELISVAEQAGVVKSLRADGGQMTKKLKVGGEMVNLDTVEDNQIRIAVLQKRIPTFNVDSIPEAQRGFYVEARFREEASKIQKQAAARRNDMDMEAEPGGESAEGEEEAEPSEGEEASDGRQDGEDTESEEPRKVRADAVGQGANRRKDARDEFVNRMNSAGMLPKNRRIG